jgi:hypothetical protein
MHGHNHAGALGDETLQAVGVDVGIVGIAVGEDDGSALTHEGEGGRHEGVGRHDDLVAGTHVAQDGRHLEGVGAGGGQQGLLEAVLRLEELLAEFRVLAVA